MAVRIVGYRQTVVVSEEQALELLRAGLVRDCDCKPPAMHPTSAEAAAELRRRYGTLTPHEN